MATDDAIFTALGAFILDVLPALAGPLADPRRNIRQGNQNNAPMPAGPNFVIMVPASRAPLATTMHDYRPSASPAPATGFRDTTRSTRVGIMVNFYGPSAADNGQTFATLFRDMYGCDFLRSAGIQPLYCDDGRQMPLIDDQKQYTARWVYNTLLQANPTISTSQQFADTLELTVLEADK